jgi:beta-N-acetylhexosaminidase
LLIFDDDSRSESGRMLDQQVRHRIPDARVLYIDTRTASGMTAAVLSAVEKADKVIVAVYEVPVAGKAVPKAGGEANSLAVPSASAALLQQIMREAAPKTVFVAMGNPYIISQFPGAQNYVCTFSNMQVSEISAAKALFGEIPMPGHLPVTIPDIAPRGAGLGNPAQRSTGGSK